MAAESRRYVVPIADLWDEQEVRILHRHGISTVAVQQFERAAVAAEHARGRVCLLPRTHPRRDECIAPLAGHLLKKLHIAVVIDPDLSDEKDFLGMHLTVM